IQHFVQMHDGRHAALRALQFVAPPGDFLYRFHFELYGMPRLWARWLVGAATMFMLVAIISGVITHKKIFTDFFTFRPRKGQRSWLDGHNATAVLALPFNFLITFSGLLLLMYQLMPWAVDAAYQGDARAFFSERRAHPAQVSAPAHPVPVQAPSADALQRMLADASALWAGNTVGSLAVNRQQGMARTVDLREAHGHSLVDRGQSRRATYDAVTGDRLQASPVPQPGAAAGVYNVFTSLHLGRFADPPVRWLLFLSGLVGSFMVASGMVLWVVKRLPERRKLGATPRGHRLVEVFNVAGLAGLFLAVAAYFWLNRLVPAALDGRANWEVRGFFIVWLTTLPYAALRPHRRAWIEILAASAVALLLLPVLNGLTGGLALPHSLARGLWSVAGFDLSATALGALLAFCVYKLHRHAPAGRTAPHAVPARRPAAPAGIQGK
ncbi:PepSY-associated TM helix domain-containing protein, partial [Bordetella petrii]|uniref:PepSY-associated TM helix domain-containing protein n=1 Tax=Bordetella petrii TaxID=94624 RepID=UPI001E4EEE06